MGVDTVKLSYPLLQTPYGAKWYQDCLGRGWSATSKYGTQGPLWWCERRHDDTGVKVRCKGVGADAHLIFEGSIPKLLGFAGAAPADSVRDADCYVRALSGVELPAPSVRRLDVTQDLLDPNRRLLAAALDWNPHPRSRYTQSVHDDRSSQGHTVWQHNKTRGVRVYDKFHECKEEWARDLVRIEYQIRGAWLQKYGIDRLYQDFERNANNALDPVVQQLIERVGSLTDSDERRRSRK